MDDLMDMITSDASPTQISDKIKDLLFNKASEKIDGFRPSVAMGMFDQNQQEEE